MSGCPKDLGLCSPQCPWYVQKTSNGTEWVKCENTECEKRKEKNGAIFVNGRN